MTSFKVVGLRLLLIKPKIGEPLHTYEAYVDKIRPIELSCGQKNQKREKLIVISEIP